jgi:hypothetical protein
MSAWRRLLQTLLPNVNETTLFQLQWGAYGFWRCVPEGNTLVLACSETRCVPSNPWPTRSSS